MRSISPIPKHALMTGNSACWETIETALGRVGRGCHLRISGSILIVRAII
jgi:hypothetical protein